MWTITLLFLRAKYFLMAKQEVFKLEITVKKNFLIGRMWLLCYQKNIVCHVAQSFKQHVVYHYLTTAIIKIPLWQAPGAHKHLYSFFSFIFLCFLIFLPQALTVSWQQRTSSRVVEGDCLFVVNISLAMVILKQVKMFQEMPRIISPKIT